MQIVFFIKWAHCYIHTGDTEYHNSPTGCIASPNYPEKYGSETKKTYVIEGGEGGTIELNFKNFSTEEYFDYVTVRQDKLSSLPNWHINKNDEQFLYKYFSNIALFKDSTGRIFS